MNRPDQGPKKQKYPNAESRIKYKTDVIVRPKLKELFTPIYNTTPVDRFCCRPGCDRQPPEPFNNYNNYKPAEHHKQISSSEANKFEAEKIKNFTRSQFEYINNNLCIKSCIGNRDVLRFQMKKVSFRNYTPKILNQEINMGMWM